MFPKRAGLAVYDKDEPVTILAAEDRNQAGPGVLW